MLFFVPLIFFLFGSIIGSFLNSIIYRLWAKESPLRGRSYCPECKHKLAWYDLIPVFSFLVLKRRCRYCQKKISWQYPLVEISTGLIFLLVFKQLPISDFLNLLYLFVISCFLIIIFVYDSKHYIIPDKVIYPAIVLSLLWDLSVVKNNIFNYILAALGTAVFFLSIFLLSRGKGIGFGDVKLGFFMGLFLGFPNILAALFLAYFIGAIIGIGLIVLRKKNLKSELPFGPLLITGTFIALFWGQNLIKWYIDFFI